MRIFTIVLAQMLLANLALARDCECFGALKTDAEFCATYDTAAIGTFEIVAHDDRVAKLHFFPTEVLRGEMVVPVELFAEKDECAFWPPEGQASFVLLSGNSKRISICNAGRIREEQVHVPYVYNLADCPPGRDA